MCVDANAGARAAAKQKKLEKDAVFQQKRLQFFNKETTFARTLDRNVLGFSRSQADARSRAMQIQGKGRVARQNAVAKYFRTKKVNEGGRSRRFGVANYQGLLAAQSEVESVIDNVLGRNMAYAREGAIRKFQVQQAKGREALGIPAAYGAPVMLPPTNRLGGALQVASQVASIASTVAGFGGFNFLSKGASAASATTSVGGGLATSSTLLNAPVLPGGLFTSIGVG